MDEVLQNFISQDKWILFHRWLKEPNLLFVQGLPSLPMGAIRFNQFDIHVQSFRFTHFLQLWLTLPLSYSPFWTINVFCYWSSSFMQDHFLSHGTQLTISFSCVTSLPHLIPLWRKKNGKGVKLTGIMTTASTWKWVRKKRKEKKKRTRAKGTVEDVRKLEMSFSEMIQNKDGFYLGILGTFFAFYILIFHLSLYFYLKIVTRQQYHYFYFFFRAAFLQSVLQNLFYITFLCWLARGF